MASPVDQTASDISQVEGQEAECRPVLFVLRTLVRYVAVLDVLLTGGYLHCVPDRAPPRARCGTRGCLKKRLDLLLVERGLAPSREQAQALIMAGSVSVGSSVVDKSGSAVDEDARLSVEAPPKYVSRGGLKLERALDVFNIDVVGLLTADVGASTGGFTDCLLQRGAARVYAVDVGYGQLDWRIRTDPRVVVLERTNVRYLESLPEKVDLATVDVSFISLRLVLPAIARLLRDGGQIVSLVKPQFEAGRGKVGKGGVVRDPDVHRDVLRGLADWCVAEGLGLVGLTVSPLRGPAGNVEFLAAISPEKPNSGSLDGEIDEALREAATVAAGPHR
jgi:23S rRNA (cytidine1920-2'-O)/16S rRNA (cytidine1409-2'-O)-methyltransferase